MVTSTVGADDVLSPAAMDANEEEYDGQGTVERWGLD